MSRLSKNELAADGTVLNGYDYGVQVWVIEGKVENCGHPQNSKPCCNARKYVGQDIKTIPGHEEHAGNF